jgi:hypothetical protein
MNNRAYLLALGIGMVACGGGVHNATDQAAGTPQAVSADAWFSSLVITAPPTAAAGATGLTASVTPLANTTFKWAITGGTIQGATTGLSISFTAGTAGTLTLSCTATHAGQSSTGTVTVQVKGAAPTAPVITAPASAITGATGLSATVSAQSACSYAWTVTGGTAQSGAATPSLVFAAGSPGTLTLTCTATNAYGSTKSQTALQVAGLSPAVPAITAPATANANTYGLSATVNAVAGVTYSWIVSGPGTIVSGAGTPSLLFSTTTAGTLTLTCTATNAYGSSSAQATVKVQGLPPAAVAITAPASASAGATSLSASVPTQTGCTYAWTIVDGTLVSGATANAATFTAGSAGTLTLGCTVTNAYGSTSAQALVNVVASAPATPVLTAPSQVHAQSLANAASVQTQTGCTYAWTVTGGTLASGQGTPAITFNAGAAGTLQLTCVVTNAAQISASGQASVAVLAFQANGYYGSGLNVDALANTPVGKSVNYQVSYRIRANHTGPLAAVRPFFIWSYTTPGYALGTGGTIKVDVQTDDGSASHNPSGTSLASLIYAKPVNDTIGYYPLLAFAGQPTLQAGTLYHVVFTNIDPDPVNNWVCLDSAYMDYANSPTMQPTIPDLDLATLWRQGSTGTWSVRKTGPTESFTPILELDYADGTSQGQGYMEFWIGDAKTISGTQGVRQIFTVSGSDRIVTSASVHLKYVSGSGPLTIRLEQADGTLLDQGTVASVPVTPGLGGASWAKVTFATARTLKAGSAYNLVLSAPAGTVFTAFPMRKGSDKGYKSTTVFTDGYAQFNNGTGWTGWDQWGQLNRKDGDLEFFFEVVK